MLFLKTRFANTCNNIYNELFKEIDIKVLQCAKLLLNDIRFGFNTKINYKAYEDLETYKEILKRMIHCSDCLCDINIKVVVSKIRALTNSIC